MTYSKLARAILERISAAGMTGECYFQEWRRTAITGKNGDIRDEKTAHGQGLGVRVIDGLRAAAVSSTRLDPDSLTRSIDRVIALVPQLPEDPFLRLAQPSSMPDIGAVHDGSFRFPAPESISGDLLSSLKTIRESIEIPVELVLQTSFDESETSIVNSLGLDCTSRSTSFSRTIGITLESGGERVQWEDERQTGFLADLPPFGKIYQDLIPLLDQTIAGRPVPTGEYPVVFHPAAGRTFMHAVLGCLSGWLVNRRRTWMMHSAGKQIASPGVTIIDDPHAPRSPHSRPFDGEGVPTAPKVLIENGILRGFLDTLGTAAESGRQPGNATRSYNGTPRTGWTLVKMAPGSATPEDIISDTGDGLYIMRLIGFGIDEISGSYSIGAMGRRIVRGALGDAVAGITIAGKLSEMLMDIDRIGNDLPSDYSILCPTFRIRRIAVAGS